MSKHRRNVTKYKKTQKCPECQQKVDLVEHGADIRWPIHNQKTGFFCVKAGKLWGTFD